MKYNGQWVWSDDHKYRYNPIIDMDWENYGTAFEANTAVLTRHPVSIKWYDVPFMLDPAFILGTVIGGLINMTIYNNNY